MARREFALFEAREVTSTIGDAYSRYSRFHDLYDGLTWRLCRDPVPEEAVEIAPETFMVKSTAWSYPGFCVITLVYSVDETDHTIEVEYLWVDPIAAT